MKLLSMLLRVTGVLMVMGSAPSWAGVSPPTDTFDTADSGGWQVGPPHPAPPAINSNCGDLGAGDGCLFVQSLNVAGGPGSRLAVFNSDASWTGDFIGANITSVRLFARNTGFQDLQLRLRFQGPGGNFISTDSLTLPTGSAGQVADFSLAPEDLTPLDPSGATATLSNVTRVWIYHSVLPEFPPPVGPFEVELDDITAVVGGGAPAPAPIAVPAFHGLGLILLVALIGYLGVRRRQLRLPR